MQTLIDTGIFTQTKSGTIEKTGEKAAMRIRIIRLERTDTKWSRYFARLLQVHRQAMPDNTGMWLYVSPSQTFKPGDILTRTGTLLPPLGWDDPSRRRFYETRGVFAVTFA